MRLTRTISSAARKTLSKPMSSLAPGHILSGARWNYRIKEAVEGDNTQISTGFKAEIIQHENSLGSPQWAFIKAASPSDTTATENLERERQSYLLPGVASAACFRKLYNVFDNSIGSTGTCIALEWLDTTLAEVKYLPGALNYAIIQSFLRAALSSCIVLENQKFVNTDYKPANILLSGIETGRVVAKVGDLGLMFPTGDRFEAQPYSMRAPKVFLGQACTKPSQVWAVAAMLLSWIKPGILGEWDSPHFLIDKAWSIAKIKRLFPSWNLPNPNEVEGDTLKAAVKSAGHMSLEEPEMQAISPLDVELQGIEMPEQLRDLLRLMLIVDPNKRPSASFVLTSREFLAFEKLNGI
ncbi:hypothetical protein BT63DRAFT_450913 [Microthyrium microscopicum]|uniref:Protein kinase domain-containing protein n=1 Tax=Microthyrium microscopicum TaxID=703497 RepID=A0A6A6UN84_9PEZI|nr:hypothetical protein BT63DRAFT_450913 [Microthyrium microscopicum]